MSKLTFKFRIYPSRSQITKLGMTLDICRELYNSALQERRAAWSLNSINISHRDQEKQLPEIKKIRTDLNQIHSQVLQNVLKRVDVSFQNFFRRVKRKNGQAGFPRFQNKFRYNSFTFKQSGFDLTGDRLQLSKIGKIKIKLHREITGKIKTLTISRESTGKWYACFAAETIGEIPEPTERSVGIDCGISIFAVLSDGVEIDNPGFLKTSEKMLANAQRSFQKQPKGSRDRHKKQKIVAGIHARIKNRRSNFAHQISSFLVNSYDRIFFEDLNIKGMLKNHGLAKSIADVAWNQLICFVKYKAENADKKMIQVRPGYTSQDCSRCGFRQKMPLEVRVYECPDCDLSISRDLNAAKNILRVGLDSLGKQSLEASEFIRGE